MLGAKLDGAQRDELIASIRDRGVDYVVQEAVTLSSMPVWREGRLQPRPFTLRLFLAKVGERWQVMPGGFVRIAEHADARAVSLQRGAATADAWVLTHGPVGETTLLPTPERMPVQRAAGLLPSRAADNLFWVGRYVERAEATLRLVRAIINRFAEADEAAAPVIAGIGALLDAWNAIPRRRISASASSWRAPRSPARTWKDRCRLSPAPRGLLLPSSATASRPTRGERSTISPP